MALSAWVNKHRYSHGHGHAVRTLIVSLFLAAAGDALIMLVNHAHAVLRADMAWYHWLQTGLVFLILFTASVYSAGRLGGPTNA